MGTLQAMPPVEEEEMNVGQLIEELKKYPLDLPVICSAEGGHVEVPIDWVKPLNEKGNITKTEPFHQILLGED